MKVTFLPGTYVWLPDDTDLFLPAKVMSKFEPGKPGVVATVATTNNLGSNRKLSANETKDLLPMDPQSLKMVDDMVTLKQLDKASILHNLRLRFEKDNIYTNIGSILVAVNPFKTLPLYGPEIVDMYLDRGSAPGKSLPPHIYAVGEEAFNRMMRYKKSQSCIVSGESGSGKTETTKLFLQYVAEKSSALAAQFGAQSDTNLQEQILQANPLLEAFGNAKTVRNDNSSRFGKWIQVKFSNTRGVVAGASVTNYLLEKTRIVNQAEGERNYHVFYQLCAAAQSDAEMKKKLSLTDADSYYYLNQSTKEPSTIIEGMDDAFEWTNTINAMETMGMKEEQINSVCQVVSGIMTLGNVNFEMKGDKSSVSNAKTLEVAAKLFGTTKEALEQAFCFKNLSNAREKIFQNQTKEQAEFTRDAFAKSVYSLLFDWLIGRINTQLSKSAVKLKKGEACYTGILDIFGFESFESNSFEQLLINFANEKLQGHFNEHIFKLEQKMYKSEGIDVTAIEFIDNMHVISVIERKVTGILSIIDDEMNLPKGTDDGFLRKLLSPQASSDPKLAKMDSMVLQTPNMKSLRNSKNARMCFNVVHYAGEVSYDSSGFLSKNKDVLPEDLQTLGAGSSLKFMKTLFAQMIVSAPKRGSTNPNKKSLSMQFKEQLTMLMATLNSTEPHFVRCIKPNSEKSGGIFTPTMVMDQLNCAGLLEVCRIRQMGYPIRKGFKEFLFEYRPIAPSAKDHKDLATKLQKKKILSGQDWQFGKSQVFLRVNQFTKLEAEREKALGKVILKMQKIARGFVVRRRVSQLMKVLADIKKATKDRDFDKLSAALLQTGALPRNGRHLPVVIAGTKVLDALKVEKQALGTLEEAIAGRDQNALETAIKTATSLKVTDKSAAGKKLKIAKDLLKTIKKETEAKAALKEATKANDLKKLEAALATAAKLKVMDTSEAKEATATKARIEEINKTAAELEKAIGKGDQSKVAKLMETMVGLGAKDHEMVSKGEKVTKAAAKASKGKQKEMDDVETGLAEAVKKQDLGKLVELEIKVIELGLTSEIVTKAMALREKLEGRKGIVAVLAVATKAINVKCKSPAGITVADVKEYAKVVNKAKKELGEDDDDVEQGKSTEKQLKKQVRAQEGLAEALKNKKPKQLKAALVAAQELGLETADATAVAAEVRELEGDAQEKNAEGDEKSRAANLDNLKDATTEQESNEVMQRLRKLASSKHAKLIKEASDNSRYDMGLYYKIRTDEDFTAMDPADQKAQRASFKLWSVNKPIPKSLLDIDHGRSRTAVRVNRAMLQYCGDKSSMFPDAQAQYILMRGLEDPEITNEIYLQLCKHLRGNAKYESANRTWLLLCMCAKTFPPTEEFAPYLLNYLINRKEAPGLFGNYARFCIVQLDATLTVGATVFKPKVEEIECYKKRPPILATVKVLDGTTLDFPVTPDLRVSTVLNMVVDATHVSEDEGPVWGIFIKDSARKEELDIRLRLVRFYQHYNPSKMVNVDSIMEIWQDNVATLFQKLTEKYGAEPTDEDLGIDESVESAANGDRSSKKVKQKGRIAMPVSAAKYAAKMLGIQSAYGAPPPPPESAWPLPWWVYLGDVYSRMLRQDREPVFIFKRRIFTDKTPDDEATFQQCMADVAEGDLVIKSDDELAELAAMTLATRAKNGKAPKSASKLISKHLVGDVIPEGKLKVKGSMEEWAKAIANKAPSVNKMETKKRQAKFIKICKESPVFGMCFFYAIRQDSLGKGTTSEQDQYAVGVDRHGVHVLGPDRDFVIRSIPLTAIKRFGATSEYFWMNVDESADGKKDEKKKSTKKGKAFSLMKGGSKNGINVLLYTIQSWEAYALIYDFMHM